MKWNTTAFKHYIVRRVWILETSQKNFYPLKINAKQRFLTIDQISMQA